LEASLGHVANFRDPRLYIALAFLAVVPSLGAYFCFDRLVAIAGPARASLSVYLIPVFATLAAWPLLGEAPRLYHAAGFGIILAGVLFAAGKRSQGADKAQCAGRGRVGSSIIEDPSPRF
jgi:drug/metabolite transporter (DMT)-like permease